MSADPERRASRRDLALFVAIAVVGFALRIVAVLQYQASHPNSAHVVIDEASYDRWARAIAAGDWLGKDVFFQEPLYPYALGSLYALVGPSLLAARVAQCALWAVAIVIVGLLGKRLFGRAAGCVAAVALALYGPGLLFPALLLKENLFLPVIAALALAIVVSRPLAGARAAVAWVAIGALAGIGALLRGNVLVLLPVLALWPVGRELFQRERVAPAFALSAAFVLGAALALVPVAWRNAHVGGVFVLTTSGAGTNVYGGNNLENPYGRATEFSFVRGIPEYEAGDWRHEAERRTGRELGPREVSSFWMDEALRSMRERPFEHARILWNKLRLSLGAYEVPDNHMLAWDARYVPIARWPWPGFGVVGMLGVAGVLTWAALAAMRRRAPAMCAGGASEVAVLFALYLGTIVLTVASDRARLPLLAMLAPFAGFFAVNAVSWAREKRRVELGVAASALFVAALFAHVPALPAEDRAEDWDERDHNLAVQWLDDAEHHADGRRLAEGLLAKHPRTARIRLLVLAYDERRARRLFGEGNATARDAARAQFAEIARQAGAIADDAHVFPRERFRANALAAWTALARPDPHEAVRRFELARAFDPADPDLRAGAAMAEVARMNAVWMSDLRLSRGGSAARPTDEERTALRERVLREIEPLLDRLQVLALDRDLRPDARAHARILAGWMQIDLGRPDVAIRHFRAAHHLAESTETSQALAVALTARAQQLPSSSERDALVAEARALIRASAGEIHGLEQELDALGGG